MRKQEFRFKYDGKFILPLSNRMTFAYAEHPTVLWKFPQDFGDQDVLQTVPKFCFPFDVESYLPWFEIYYKLLNTLADYLSKHQEDDLNDMLETLHNHPVPKPNTPVNLSVHSYFIAPDINGLPTIPENRNLTEYFVAVDVNNMLHLYASMLHERRIIITSSKLSTLTACVQGSTAMLYPMHWQHIFIPVLPPHLLDYCCAPMPYLVGVHLSLLERVRSRFLEDVVILNVDTNTLESPTDDLHNLPSDVGEPITFCEKSFVAHRSSTMRSFLEMAVNLQLFKQAKDHAKRKIRDMKDKITQKDAEEEESPYCEGSPTSTKSLSPRRLQRGALQNPKSSPHMSLCLLDGFTNDNNDDTASRISSEDSGEVASYNEDSDDSDLEFQSEVSQTGEMNLLEEILDSLSTSHIEEGRLSAAKSLDFFRSMEDLDYNPMKNCKSPLGGSPAQAVSEVGNGEQGGWNMGQDDSAVHGKHLPPSPRRQPSSRSLPVRPLLPKDLTNEDVSENPRNSLPETPTIQLSVPCDTDKPGSSQLSPDSQQPTGRSLSRQKVFSRKTQRPPHEHAQQKAAGGQPSVFVPWERENQPQETDMEARGKETQEKGLLEEIESMCRISMAIKSNEELTYLQNNTSLDKS
ncbi:DENN domain-containing 1B isoform X2 [Labeo rohita]|uniref:DENN domain-containing 1B isoform X2 n=1 Tax=Labeo rohita TaxID=84645 RepID=A0A498MPB7_LABRO|nr:DENN domain-containing 1B isoform X2 [Labeo rohita]